MEQIDYSGARDLAGVVGREKRLSTAIYREQRKYLTRPDFDVNQAYSESITAP
jgi:hypothetical protein